MLVVLAGAAIAVALRARARFGRLTLALSASAAAVLLAMSAGPTAAWRHSPIGVGRVDLGKASPNLLQEWLNQRRRMLAWEEEGIESSVALLKTTEGIAFTINGKVDGVSRGDAATQVMGGLVGAALHGAPRRALVVGLGTGSTAGWLAAVPTVERVDVVELEKATLRVARDCAVVNRDVMSNPKVRTLVGDGREFLPTTRESYDVIFSEPSNPFRAGISSLFTREFYRSIAPRLSEGGVFVQWLQAYEVDAGAVRTAYATLASVFPNIETWCGTQNDLLLVATRAPLAPDGRSLSDRLSREPYKSAMLLAWRVEGLEGFLSHFLARTSFAMAVAAREGQHWNTDDRNLIEFAFARSLGNAALFEVDELRTVAGARGEDRPEISGEVDWDRVARERIATSVAEGVRLHVQPGLPRDLLRQALVLSSFADGKPELVLGPWRAQAWSPRGPVEIAAVADALAFGGDEGARPFIGALARYEPVEADVALARLLWRQRRASRSPAATSSASGRAGRLRSL